MAAGVASPPSVPGLARTFGSDAFPPTSGRKLMFQGKTALVTSSTSGIGLGIATAFAAQGANIILNGFGDPADIDKLAAKLAAGPSRQRLLRRRRPVATGRDRGDDGSCARL